MSGSISLPQLSKAYDPATAEVEVTKRWTDAGMSAAEATGDPGRPTYSIVIPPPNVTAALHLGHALNNT
ncbi:MAG: class I tRNA ligase family protein, partial [Actinomycetota bacterium]